MMPQSGLEIICVTASGKVGCRLLIVAGRWRCLNREVRYSFALYFRVWQQIEISHHVATEPRHCRVILSLL